MEHRYTYAAIGSGSGAAGFFLTTFLTAFLGAATAPDASPTTPVILAFGSSIATTAAAGSVLSGAAEAGNFFLVFFFGAAATGASLEVVTPTGVTPATTSFDAVSSGACGRTGCFFVTFLTGFFTSPRASVPVVGFFGTLLTGFTASSTAEGASAVCGTSAAGGASATMSLVVAAWSGAGASVFGTWTVVSEGSFFAAASSSSCFWNLASKLETPPPSDFSATGAFSSTVAEVSAVSGSNLLMSFDGAGIVDDFGACDTLDSLSICSNLAAIDDALVDTSVTGIVADSLAMGSWRS
mmetsp:Transcript_9564/g.28901  ORF Transcript_9564/g.28901 Transcript_9564/m.28901 type:complete len:296 (-) Transcript_9564:1248-2135(-)